MTECAVPKVFFDNNLKSEINVKAHSTTPEPIDLPLSLVFKIGTTVNVDYLHWCRQIDKTHLSVPAFRWRNSM